MAFSIANWFNRPPALVGKAAKTESTTAQPATKPVAETTSASAAPPVVMPALVYQPAEEQPAITYPAPTVQVQLSLPGLAETATRLTVMDAAAATALPQQSSPAPRLTDLYDQEIAAQTAAPSTALADAIPERTSADAIELLREAPVEQAARSVAEIIAQSTYAMVARASAGQPDLRSLVGKA